MSEFELLAGGAGAASGLAAAWLSAATSSRLGDDRFWSRWFAVARSLLSLDDRTQILREYLRLWPALGAFTAKKLAIAMIGLSPVVLAFAWLAPLGRMFWDAHATWAEVAPPQQLVVERPGGLQYLDEHHHRIPLAAGSDAPAAISTPQGRLRCTTLMHKQAYASCWTERLLLGLLGFEILQADQSPPTEMRSLLVRPSCGDGNPLWPYLSDWEFAFFAVVCLTFGTGALVLKCRA